MRSRATCSGFPDSAGSPGLFWVHALRVRAYRPWVLGTSSALWKALSGIGLW